jgi:hypothetical protein
MKIKVLKCFHFGQKLIMLCYFCLFAYSPCKQKANFLMITKNFFFYLFLPGISCITVPLKLSGSDKSKSEVFKRIWKVCGKYFSSYGKYDGFRVVCSTENCLKIRRKF